MQQESPLETVTRPSGASSRVLTGLAFVVASVVHPLATMKGLRAQPGHTQQVQPSSSTYALSSPMDYSPADLNEWHSFQQDIVLPTEIAELVGYAQREKPQYPKAVLALQDDEYVALGI